MILAPAFWRSLQTLNRFESGRSNPSFLCAWCRAKTNRTLLFVFRAWLAVSPTRYTSALLTIVSFVDRRRHWGSGPLCHAQFVGHPGVTDLAMAKRITLICTERMAGAPMRARKRWRAFSALSIRALERSRASSASLLGADERQRAFSELRTGANDRSCAFHKPVH